MFRALSFRARAQGTGYSPPRMSPGLRRDPLPHRADRGFVFPPGRHRQKVAPGVERRPEGLHECTAAQFFRREREAEQRHAMTRKRGEDGVGFVRERQAGGLHRPAPRRRDAGFLEPSRPQRGRRCAGLPVAMDQLVLRQIGRALQAQHRAAQRRVALGHQLAHHQAWPVAAAGAHRDVGAAARQVDQRVAGVQSQLDAVAGLAKGRHARQHPACREGGVGGERDGLRGRRLAQPFDAGLQRVEARAQIVEQAHARRRQRELPREPAEQWTAQRVFERAHLVADGRRRDRKLQRRALEAQVRGRRLEGPQREQGRQAPGAPHG